MQAWEKWHFAHSVVAAAAGSLALMLCAAQAQDKTPTTAAYVMKISTPTINDVPDTYARNLGRPWSGTRAAVSRSKFIRQASSARSRGRSRVLNLEQFSAKFFHPSSLSASTSALR